MLQEEVQDKKSRLKERMRENMGIIRSVLEDNGVKDKLDIIGLVKSKSTKDRFHAISSYAATPSLNT